MKLLTERYQDKISGQLSCYDRVLLSGTLPEVCYAEGMTRYLLKKKIKIFDYPNYAKQFKDIIRSNMELFAENHSVEIEYLSNTRQSKEQLIAQKIKERGTTSGIIHILSAMELCHCYRRSYNPQTKWASLKNDTSKCIHYYVYFIDEDYGLCHLRIPTWLPCRLQFYFNGHSYLACQLDKAGIAYHKLDNAFSWIENWDKAQQIANSMQPKDLHKKLDDYASLFCPITTHFKQAFHWSINQAEYATDLSFKKQKDLQAIYSQLVATAIHTVKPDNIATFLGKKQLHGNYKEEVGNRYNIRIEGSRIRHQMGKQSIKMYDKFGQILRIETTSSNISFFKHYRRVEHKDGTYSNKFAPFKKNLYSLKPLRAVLLKSNQRYLEFISAIDDNRIARKRLQKVTQKVRQNNRNYRGLNFFDPQDENLLQAISQGQFNIYGFRNKDLRQILNKTSSQVSRLIKNLRLHGLVKKVAKTHKYYLTSLGKEVILTGLKIKELVVLPAMNF